MSRSVDVIFASGHTHQSFLLTTNAMILIHHELKESFKLQI